MKYTGNDIVSIFVEDHDGAYGGDGVYYIDLENGAKCDIPYSAISDEDFAFLNPPDDFETTEEYEDKCLDIFAKYINQCEVIRDVEE